MIEGKILWHKFPEEFPKESGDYIVTIKCEYGEYRKDVLSLPYSAKHDLWNSHDWEEGEEIGAYSRNFMPGGSFPVIGWAKVKPMGVA